MSEKRLIEVSLGIIDTDGPLSMLVYLNSLNVNEIKEIGSYIGRSKNFYSDLIRFSCNYLKSKGINYDRAKEFNFGVVNFSDNRSNVFDDVFNVAIKR